MPSHARSDESGAGRSGSDRGASQFSESSRREEAEHNQGKVARGMTEAQQETAHDEHESSTKSRK